MAAVHLAAFFQACRSLCLASNASTITHSKGARYLLDCSMPSQAWLMRASYVQLIQLVRKLYEDGARHGQALEADSLAEVLVQRGHTVTVRTALGGGGGCECLRNLRHVFLSVRIQVSLSACPFLMCFIGILPEGAQSCTAQGVTCALFVSWRWIAVLRRGFGRWKTCVGRF